MHTHSLNSKSRSFLSSLLLSVVIAGLTLLIGCGRRSESPDTYLVVGDVGFVVIGQGGANVEHKFIVENPSKNLPIHMQLIEKSCSCMGNLPEVISIQPGESMSLSVVASVNSVYATTGEVHWSVLYRTDFPSMPQVALVLKATVAPEVEAILPPLRDWEIDPNETKTIVFRTVCRYDSQNSRGDILLRQDCYDFVKVLRIEREHKGRYWEITLDCEVKIPRIPSGYGGVRERETATILFVTDNGKTFEVPVIWTQRNYVTCAPRHLFFNAMRDSHGEQTVWLRSDTDFRLINLSDDRNNLTFRADSNGSGGSSKSIEITFLLAPHRRREPRAMVTKGEIVVKLDHPSQRQVRIGYSILEASKN